MKKSLTLAIAMALGITASAYAANPFSDVPQGHWAYDSVAQLVAEGVIEGYPEGNFDGNKLMTRYEMAQIVARLWRKVPMLTSLLQNLLMNLTIWVYELLNWKKVLTL